MFDLGRRQQRPTIDGGGAPREADAAIGNPASVGALPIGDRMLDLPLTRTGDPVPDTVGSAPKYGLSRVFARSQHRQPVSRQISHESSLDAGNHGFQQRRKS